MFFKDLEVRDPLFMELRPQQGPSFGPFVTVDIEYSVPKELESAIVHRCLYLFPPWIQYFALSEIVELCS